MTKKRNKKYNPIKHAEICTDYALKNAYVANTTKQDHCVLINKRAELIEINERVYRAIAEITHVWGIYLAAFGVEPGGDPYIKSDAFVTTERFLQGDLTDFIKARHDKLIKNFNTDQFVGAGWIASPVGKDLTEIEAFNIFEKLGAW